MNILYDRIDRLFKKNPNIGDYTKESIIQKIKQFRNDHIGYFSNCEHTELIDDYLNEFDFILTLMFDFYNNIISEKQNGNYIELGRILLIKAYIHDLIAVREMANLKLESQFANAARALMERSLVITLSMYDLKFCDELFINKNNLDENERYYKLFRPAKLIKRLNAITDGINPIKGSNWENMYAFFSKFSHNDILLWLKYYDEGSKYDLSIYNGISLYFDKRLTFIIQSIVFFVNIPISQYLKVKNNLYIGELFLYYSQEIIEDSYNNIQEI